MQAKTYRNIIGTCWALAEEGLDALTVTNISARSGIPEMEISPLFPEEKFILLALISDIKSQVPLLPLVESQPQNDQFFDAVMSYYDECQAHKAAIKRLTQDLMWNPILSLSITPHLQQISNNLTDVYYPIPDKSLKESFQEMGHKLAIQILLLRVFFKWLDDDSFDQGETMATLDGGIKQIDQLKAWF